MGRIVLGPKVIFPEHVEWGWKTAILDNSRISKSYGGQTFVDSRPKARTAQLTLNWASESEAFNSLLAAFRANGEGIDMLVIPQEGSSFVHQQAIWGLAKLDGLTAVSPNVYRISISIEERL